MKAFMVKHFTVGGLVTLGGVFITFITLIGAVYVFADDMEETQNVVVKNSAVIELNLKHAERTDVHQTAEQLDLKFVSKPVFEQFEKQLFIQLERMEKKLDNK